MNTKNLGHINRVGATTVVCGALLTGSLVACGTNVSRKVAVKNQVGAAQSNLENSKTASFTLHLDDPNNEFLAAYPGSDKFDKNSSAVQKDSSLTLTVDPDGDQTIGAAFSASRSSDKRNSGKQGTEEHGPAKALKSEGFYDLTWDYKGNAMASLRSVSGNYYLRVVPSGYQSVFGESMDKIPGNDASQVRLGVADFRDGKWMKLDPTKPIDGSGVPLGANTLTTSHVFAEASRAFDAVQKDSTYTVAKKGNTAVVSAKIDAQKTLSALKQATDFNLDVTSKPGSVNGSITTTDDHVTKMDVDLGSAAALSNDPAAKRIKTAKLVVDVNDDAAPVTAISADKVSKVDAGSFGTAVWYSLVASPTK